MLAQEWLCMNILLTKAKTTRTSGVSLVLYYSTRHHYRNTRANLLAGLSRAAIFSAVEASLERLGTTYIDVLQIHRYDHTVPPEETMGALHDLVRSGKVRYLGASSMWTYQFATLQHVAEKHGFTKFVAMQNHYNLMYREEEREMNRYCKMTGVGLIPVGDLSATHVWRC